MVSVSINSLYLFVVIMKIRGKAAVWRWGGFILKIIKKITQLHYIPHASAGQKIPLHAL
jgi:hypothetical protein